MPEAIKQYKNGSPRMFNAG